MSFSPQSQPTSPLSKVLTSSSIASIDRNPTVPAPVSSSNASSINPQDLSALRSCVTCRRRKVRCNKRNPCSNCAKAGIDCVFPPPGRARRKSKRPQDAELLSRLRRLEGVIAHLSEQKAATASANLSEAASSPEKRTESIVEDQPAQTQSEGRVSCPFLDPNKRAPLEHEFGRLVIEEGRSRYVSNRFWASLGDEIEELQDILDPSSSDEDDHPSPESSTSYSTNHDGFLFGFYSINHSLRSFFLPPNKVADLWDIYSENVAPVLPIVWTPTARKLFRTTIQSIDSLDKNTEALLLSLYFVTIVSATNGQCRSIFGEDRDICVNRYRFAVEQALSRANLLNTQSMVLLQAAMVFLNAVRYEDDSKFVWAMTALVLRLAQGLGLQRDGTNFGLTPFDTEMRRRLWWHIIIMDLRSAEDHGTDPQIHERMFDTRTPLNVNEDDISPDMKEPPPERESFTTMTFLLIQCEIGIAMRRVNYTCPYPNSVMPENKQDISDKCGNIIQSLNKRLEDRYLKYCDMNIPIQWVCATVGRLILTKLWLVIHHPMTRPDRPVSINNASRESLFVTSVELAEFVRLLKACENTQKWTWLIANHMQSHAIAFVLSELCVRPLCPLTDRAWCAVSTLYDEWLKTDKQKKGMLWRPLARLMKRASAFRDKQRLEMQAHLIPDTTCLQKNPSSSIHTQSIGETVYASPDPNIQASATTVPSQENPSGGSMDFDLSKGPIQVINDIFPDMNWLASPPAQIARQQSFMAANAPSSVPHDPLPIEPPSAPNMQLNWEEWDQVMRDFHTDLQEEQGSDQAGGNTAGWFT